MPFKIINQRVEHGEEQSESPVEFMIAMKDFVSGQVYRVLKQDPDGGYKCLSEPHLTFADRVAMARDDEERKDGLDAEAPNENLVYIVSQDILFDDEV